VNARVAETIERYRMFATGQHVGVAVSGGADSVCLLHILVELAPRWNLHLAVLHLDHQLRGEESSADSRFVEELARTLGLPFCHRRIDVARLAGERGDNLEQTARNARREFFLDCMKTRPLDRVATGHTRSDQAETVLFRFLRGAGTAGLAGIRPVTAEGFVRPLIGVNRHEIVEYLAGRGITWREDSSNTSPDFARNRIRRELLPMLEREWNPAIAETLVHTADWAFEEEAYWAEEVERLARGCLEDAPPAILMSTERLTALPPAAGRRLVRRAIERVKGNLLGIDFGHVSAVLALAGQPQGHGRLQVPGVDVYRSFDWLRLAPPGMDSLENRNFRVPAPVPGSVLVPGTKMVMVLQLIDNNRTTEEPDSRYNEWVNCLDWDRVSGVLELRNWRPGDQYRPVGSGEPEKVKLLFQQARIPLWERRNWPVITRGDQIVWSRRFGAAAEVAATRESRVVLKIQETSA
jgi:tRNA(Ile)-lysidine synthase